MATVVVLAAVALFETALGLLASLIFLGRLGLPRAHRSGSVTLIMPLTGNAPHLDRLLRALDRQSLRPRRLIVSVESKEDPAYGRAMHLAGTGSFPINIVVAGKATRCAQKCENLIAALQKIDDRDEAVVFLDADILPPPWWLSALVTPLIDGSAEIVNGYRWPTIAAPTVGAHMSAGIERAIAMLPRPRWLSVTWGGSLALSPRALAVLEPGHILADTLSDDFTIGKHAGALGLRVLTRRALLVPTPMEGGLMSVWLFARRQYQICRIYMPSLWWLALGTLSTRLVAWGLLLAYMDRVEARMAIAALIALAFTGCLVQAQVALRLGFPDTPAAQFVQCLLAVFKPVVDLFHWTAVVAAFASGVVRWSHVTYRVSGPTDVIVRTRDPWI